MRIVEQSNPCNDSEPSGHLRENPSHSFSSRILRYGPIFSQEQNHRRPNDPTITAASV